jgi:hypothetical protein
LQGNIDGFLHKDDYVVGGSPTGWLFNYDILGGGLGILVRNSPAGQNAPARQSPTAFVMGTWYNFIGVRQGNSVALYIDGQLAATAASASPININNNVNLDIGALGIGDRQYFNGAVDEVQLYNHALSGAEIEAIADVPEGSTYAAVFTLLGLAGWQRLRRRGFPSANALRLSRSATVGSLALFALLCAGRPAKAQGSYFDATFSDSLWSSTLHASGNGGSLSASQVLAGGNPGPFRSITHTVNSAGGLPSVVYGYHFSPLMTYEFQPGAGISSIDYSIHYRTVSNAQVGLGLAIRQNGDLFFGGYAVVSGGAWQSRNVAGLQANGFNSLVSSVLDFSESASPIEIGFFTANSTDPFLAGYTATIQVDNFAVTPHSVPEASTNSAAALVVLLSGIRARAIIRHGLASVS